jgi:hypothetical protein
MAKITGKGYRRGRVPARSQTDMTGPRLLVHPL